MNEIGAVHITDLSKGLRTMSKSPQLWLEEGKLFALHGVISSAFWAAPAALISRPMTTVSLDSLVIVTQTERRVKSCSSRLQEARTPDKKAGP